MLKLDMVERIKEAIDAAPLTEIREVPSRHDGRPWEVFSVPQGEKKWPVRVHSAHTSQSDAHAAWVMLERQKIARAVIEAMREPDRNMTVAGLDRFRDVSKYPELEPTLELVWTAMVDRLLSDLPHMLPSE